MLTVKDTRILLRLAIPLVLSGLVESSLGFTSTIFLSKLGAHLLAAGALVAWLFATLMVVFWGIFTALSVTVAHRQGAKDQLGIAFALRDGLWLALIMTVPITLLIWHTATILLWLGQSKYLVTLAIPYLHALAYSILPDFVGLILLQFVVGLGHTRTNLVFTLSWVILNIAANYVFIFGRLGLPALGIAGLGWGTTFSFWITAIAWLTYLLARKQYRAYFGKIFKFQSPYYYWELLKVGLPTGLMWCIEVTFFFVLLLMIGQINERMLAASQVAIQYSSLFVTLLFALSQAITVRVSNRQGAGEVDGIKNALHSGMLCALIIMLILATVTWLFPNYLISLDFDPLAKKNAFVVEHAKVFLKISVLFLLLEAVRISLFGALRGLKDTKSTLLGSLVSFWLIAMPLGQLFARVFHWGVLGLWFGLLVSGFVGVAFLLWRYRIKINTINLKTIAKT